MSTEPNENPPTPVGSSDLIARLVDVSAALTTPTPLPVHGDEWTWCKTTPISEQKRIIAVARKIEEKQKRLAVEIKAVIDEFRQRTATPRSVIRRRRIDLHRLVSNLDYEND